jgi:hypothetical protein
LAFPGDVADACTNIQQVAEEEEEEEDTPHVDTWHNVMVRVDFFDEKFWGIRERNHVTIRSKI